MSKKLTDEGDGQGDGQDERAQAEEKDATLAELDAPHQPEAEAEAEELFPDCFEAIYSAITGAGNRVLTLAAIICEVFPKRTPVERQQLEDVYRRRLAPNCTQQAGVMLAHALQRQLIALVDFDSLTGASQDEKNVMAELLTRQCALAFARAASTLLELVHVAEVYKDHLGTEHQASAKSLLDDSVQELRDSFVRAGRHLAGDGSQEFAEWSRTLEG